MVLFRSGLFGRSGSGALCLNTFQQRFGGVVAADEFGVVLAPLLGEFASEGFGEYGLGELVNAGLGVFDLLLDLVGVGEELFYAADYFGLFFEWRQGYFRLFDNFCSDSLVPSGRF